MVSGLVGGRKNTTLQWVIPSHSYNQYHHINIRIPPPPKNTTSWWKEKRHRRKLQWVKPPHVQVEYLCQKLRAKHYHRKLPPMPTTASTSCKDQDARCKGQDQHQCKSEHNIATTCNSNYYCHRPAQDQHQCWWSAQCRNYCNLFKGTIQIPSMPCNVVFSFHPLAQIPYLHSCNLHCVVVVSM